MNRNTVNVINNLTDTISVILGYFEVAQPEEIDEDTRLDLETAYEGLSAAVLRLNRQLQRLEILF